MSLFKARDWWSVTAGAGEAFDAGCLCVANILNKSDGFDKIIIGSFSGVLRIYSPKPSSFQPDHLLIESQLQEPILQLLAGKFVSGSSALHLAVLHPRKLVVYNVVAVSGTELASHCTLTQMYQHNLERTSCNMTLGSFGGVSGRDFLCVQSMDGYLSFFEQESFAFGRFLPGFLLPGPIQYIPKTDSFVTCTSSRTVEAFKYMVLAVATVEEDRSKQDDPSTKKGSGKRVMVDWSVNIGDHGIEIYVTTSESLPSIFVLGERGLYCLNDNGTVRFMKKLEYNPSCFLPYFSVADGAINTMVATYTEQLLIYQDVRLAWAAQLPTLPVAVRVARFLELEGVIVTLDGQGRVNCCYLGTDPSFSVIPSVAAREFNYEEAQEEMKELNKIAREHSKSSSDALPGIEEELKLIPFVSPELDATPFRPDELMESEEDSRPSVTVKLRVNCQSHMSLLDVIITIHCEPPLSVDHSIAHLMQIGPPNPESELEFIFFTVGNFLPLDLSVTATASYANSTGAPRLVQCMFSLPLSLFCSACPPAKSAEHKITLETNRPTVPLPAIFPDFELPDLPQNVLAVQFHSEACVTILASKNSQRYRLQSDALEALSAVVVEFDRRIRNHFGDSQDFEISFIGNLPTLEYFTLIETHLEARLLEETYQHLLAERAQQFRSIQKRLLTRFKDKTPSPLANLDTLLDGTYRQLMAIGEAHKDNSVSIHQKANSLACGTNLMLYILQLRTRMSPDEFRVLSSAMSTRVPPPGELGWEEITLASIQHLLRSCLAKNDREQSTTSAALKMPRDATRLEKHIALFFDRLLKGGKLSLIPQAIRPIPKSEALKASAGDENDSGLAINGDTKDILLPKHNQPNPISPPPPSAESAAFAVSAVMSAAFKGKSRLSPLPEVTTGQTV